MKRNKPLSRKTPLKKSLRNLRSKSSLSRGTKGLKKSKLKSQSRKRRGENEEYLRLRALFLAEHPFCKVCQDMGISNGEIFINHPHFKTILQRPMPATEVHHKGKRFGKWLCDVRFFLPVCRPHHRYIEDHRQWAEERGYTLTIEMIRLIEEGL